MVKINQTITVKTGTRQILPVCHTCSTNQHAHPYRLHILASVPAGWLHKWPFDLNKNKVDDSIFINLPF